MDKRTFKKNLETFKEDVNNMKTFCDINEEEYIELLEEIYEVN